MARTYAAVLGFLGFAAAVARGIVENQHTGQTLGQAVFNLVAFGFFGLLVGRIAQWTVDDSIRSQLAAQMPARANTIEQAPRAAA